MSAARAAPHVVHVLDALRHSGAERMLESLGPLAAADGIAQTILSTGEADAGPLAAALAAAGYRIDHLPFSRTAGFVLRLFAYFRRTRPDVVHLHAERAAVWSALAARAGGSRRLVRTIHGLFPFDGRLGRVRRLQRMLQRRLGVRSFALSEAVIENEARRFGNPVSLQPACTDPARFRPPLADERRAARARLGLGDDCFAVACVGACSAVKNHAALIEAIADLARAAIPIRLIHVGDGEDCAAEQALATARGIADRVRFCGRLDDVAGVLQAVDAYAMPSLREGLGIAALEALACGVPAVLTDVAGLRAFRDFGPAVRWCGSDAPSIAAALGGLAAMPAAARRAACDRAPVLVRDRFGPAAAWAAHRRAYGLDPT